MNAVPVLRELTAADIAWDLQPAPADEAAADSTDLLVNVLLEAQAYRTLAQQATHALHELHRRFDRQQAAYHGALDELKALRASRAAHEATTPEVQPT